MKRSKWNWQFEDWPHFIYDEAALESLEHEFLQKAGMVTGAFAHIKLEEKENKKEYYRMLEKHNRSLDLTGWLIYFGNTIIEAQEHTLKMIEFLISKAQFLDRFDGKLNERQL